MRAGFAGLGLGLLALAALNACASGGDASRGPADAGPTLPPGTAFRDALVYAAVKAKLAGADIDSAARISVAVQSGVVTLRGTVADAPTRARDVELVRTMRGVNGVTDRLRVGRVGPSTAQRVGDAALVAAVTSALAAQTGINVAGVTVHAAAGTITLGGHADTSAIRATMVAAAKKTPGVRNVVDRIAVR